MHLLVLSRLLALISPCPIYRCARYGQEMLGDDHALQLRVYSTAALVIVDPDGRNVRHFLVS